MSEADQPPAEILLLRSGWWFGDCGWWFEVGGLYSINPNIHYSMYSFLHCSTNYPVIPLYRRGGETGRRTGLKILFPARRVPVRFRSPALACDIRALSSVG